MDPYVRTLAVLLKTDTYDNVVHLLVRSLQMLKNVRCLSDLRFSKIYFFLSLGLLLNPSKLKYFVIIEPQIFDKFFEV
jgi:hypothetical protein